MKGVWQVQEAKSNLSELIGKAESDGPQIITRHGKKVAVVVSAEEYGRFQRSGESLLALCRRFAGAGDDLVIERSREGGREFSW